MRKLAACILAGIGLLSVRSFAQNTFPATGNVGIGTTSPSFTLDITGSQRLYNSSDAYLYLQQGTNPAFLENYNGQLHLQARSTPIYFESNTNSYTSPAMAIVGNNVGIGTTSPQAPLNLGGTQFQLFDPSQAQANYSYIKTSAYTFNTQVLTLGTTYGYDTPVDALSIFDGKVGIGTTSPGSKLEVNGNLKLTSGSGASMTYADGTTQTTAWTGVLCGGDYAESVDVNGDRTEYQPGDVLVIDPKHPGRFLKSAEPYSTTVTGIFATKPGVVGRRQKGPQNPDEVPMAMIGIVPTRVSAENGPIHAGDLLVTSSTLGYAMKATDRSRMPGAIVGKALGNLDFGRGVIEVVVTLQ